MDKNELMNDVKDLLVRVEGTINVLRKPDVLRAASKLQGVRDKLRHLLLKASRVPLDSEAKQLVAQLQEMEHESESNSE